MPVMDISLVCGTCRLRGESANCKHLEWLRPDWQTTERSDYVKSLYPQGQEEVFAREAQGILLKASNACFDPDLVKHVFLNKIFKFAPGDSQRYLFLTIDPCGGSNKYIKHTSECAWVTTVEQGCRVVGAESLKVEKIHDAIPILIEHLRLCFKIPALNSARLIVFIEGNMIGEANTLKMAIQDHFPDAQFPCAKDNGKLGIITDNQVKHDMQMVLNGLLSEYAVQIFHDFVNVKGKQQEVLNKLRTQLVAYSYLEVPAKTPHEANKYTYSGKGPNNQFIDDLAVALQLCVYAMKKFFTRGSKWAMYHRRIGENLIFGA